MHNCAVPQSQVITKESQLDTLKALINSQYSVVSIDLTNPEWHREIPSRCGWYFIETGTPLNILCNLPSPPFEYTNEKGEVKKCKNYNISVRVQAFASTLDEESIVISGAGLRPVYSGMAKNLLNRAREHTFFHQGTVGLALTNYRELTVYAWNFHYAENSLPTASAAHRDITLKLGEQFWRALHGWPLLCSG